MSVRKEVKGRLFLLIQYHIQNGKGVKKVKEEIEIKTIFSYSLKDCAVNFFKLTENLHLLFFYLLIL